MSAAPTRDAPMIIPETAPFSPEQRAWLSGFFAASIAALADASAAPANDAGTNGAAKTDGPVLASNDEAPWHDPAMPPDERMELAREKPLAPRLMAAMAQQDCGQCGYNCADYANAIFGKAEERLNLCAPGGKVTARLLKGLAIELNDTNGPKDAANEGGDADKSRLARGPADAAARSVPRGTGRCRVPLAQAAQPGGLREGHLAHRVRPLGQRRPIQRRRLVRRVPQEQPRAGRPDHRDAGRLPHDGGAGPDAAAGAARGRRDRARAGPALRAVLLHHGRQGPGEGAGAGARRGSGWGRGPSRRAGRAAQVPANPAAPGSLRGRAGAAAAAPLLHILLAERQCGAACR